MSYSTRVFVVAAVLVLFALFNLGSAFDVQSMLFTAEQQEAYTTLTRQTFEAEADVCFKVQCDIPAGNGTCHYFSDNGTIAHQCPGTDFCNSTQDCETRYAIGHECQNGGECKQESPYLYNQCTYNETLEHNICQKPKVGGFVGDECAVDADCHSLNCNTTCQGLVEFDECTGDDQCGRGLYCFNHTQCMNITAVGGDCESTEECGMTWTGNECVAGKCTPAFNGTVNSTCSQSGFQCESGLFCEPSTLTCQKYELIECEYGNDTQCDAYFHSTCHCNHGNGKGQCGGQQPHTTEKQAKYFKDAVKCAQDHSCPLNPQSSCFLQQCIQYIDCFFAEMINSVSGGDPACLTFTVKCDIHDGSSSQPDDSSASAIGSTSAVVISALAAIAALL